jgi:ABC-type branched-subunit amino acid transport system substrate-binding protein
MKNLERARAARMALLCLALTGGSLAARAEDGVKKDEIVIGTTLAVTGPISVCGSVGVGASAWFKRVNDAGGVNGRKIRYLVLDDAYSTQRAIGNVKRLMGQENIFAIFSGCGTATGAAVLSVAEQEPIPFLFPLAGLDGLATPPKKNVFSILPTYDQQVTTMIDFVAKARQPRTAGIVVFNLTGHEGWLKSARDKLKALDIQVLDEQVIDPFVPDKAPSVTQMKGKAPDLLVLMDTSPDAARYLLEMQRQNWRPKAVTGLYTLADESFMRAVGTLADDLVVAPGITLPASDPAARECNEALLAHDRSVPASSYTMFGCMGAKVFVDALRRAGITPTRDALIAQLEQTRGFDTGVSGPISFGPTTRQGLRALYPIGMKAGSFKVLAQPVPVP